VLVVPVCLAFGWAGVDVRWFGFMVLCQGELRHIKELRFWKLKDVLVDKCVLGVCLFAVHNYSYDSPVLLSMTVPARCVPRYDFPEADAEEFASFLLPMLRYYPSSRVTARDCLDHPFLAGVDLAKPLSPDELSRLPTDRHSDDEDDDDEEDDDEEDGEGASGSDSDDDASDSSHSARSGSGDEHSHLRGSTTGSDGSDGYLDADADVESSDLEYLPSDGDSDDTSRTPSYGAAAEDAAMHGAAATAAAAAAAARDIQDFADAVGADPAMLLALDPELAALHSEHEEALRALLREPQQQHVVSDDAWEMAGPGRGMHDHDGFGWANEEGGNGDDLSEGLHIEELSAGSSTGGGDADAAPDST